jgi:hypothetical protein
LRFRLLGRTGSLFRSTAAAFCSTFFFGVLCRAQQSSSDAAPNS